MGQKKFKCIMVRVFDFDKDYDILTTWWNAHGSRPPRPEHLSNTGIIVEVGGNPVCAGFLYNTDSKICVFEFVVSDPEASKKDRSSALPALIEEIKLIARSRGYTLIYTSIAIKAYIKRLKAAGFIEVNQNQSHLFFSI